MTNFFLKVVARMQDMAASLMAEMREPILQELNLIKQDRGQGTTVTKVDIDDILRKVGYWEKADQVAKKQRKELLQGAPKLELVPGQFWRCEGHEYLESITLRVRDYGENFKIAKTGKIKGWLSREDSEQASEYEKYVNDEGLPIAMFRNEHDDGDGEDLEEHEVIEAIRAWEEYDCAVNQTQKDVRS